MIKINPIEIAKLILSRRQQCIELPSQYVKKVAIEAEELANIWEEIVLSIQNGNEIDREKLISLGAHKYIPKNGAQYTRLQEFYINTSSALADFNVTHWVDEIVYRIGGILIDRDDINELLVSEIENAESFFFFSQENSTEALQKLTQNANAIRREASALYVLASRMEAQRT